MSDKIFPYAISLILAIMAASVLAVPAGAIPASLMLSIIVCIFVQFFFFLIGMLKGPGKRSLVAVFVFIATNMSIIVLFFAKIYLTLGINYSAGGGVSSFIDAVYFSIVTWTTLGYGDIIPSPQARLVAAFEAIMGYLVMALLIAALLELAKRR